MKAPASRKNLTQIRGFIPYLVVVLINAMIDLGHKIIIQNTIFKCYDGSIQIGLTALINACILLPFILFFTPAGFLADRFPKHQVIRWTAVCVLPLTILITGAYVMGWFETAFALTLILATQSAFYSPAKYGYIREMAGKDNLGMANGVVQAVTIVAILLGGVLFSVGFELLIGQARTKEDILIAIAPCGVLLMLGALIQIMTAWRIPCYQIGDATLRLNKSAYLRGEYLRANLRSLWADPIIRMSVLGLGLFWAVNQVLLAAFGAHLKEVSGVTSTVIAQGLLAIGGVGLMVGSMTAGRISRNHIETGLIPLAALGMTVCMAVIPCMGNIVVLGALLVVYGFFGGLLVVPLNALIQFNAPESEAGTILAGNNFVQNVFMLSFLGATVLTSLTGLGSVPVILTLAGIMALGSALALRILPQAFLRFLLRILFAQRYRLTVSGLQHIPSQGGVLFLGNHISWIDWAVLHLAVPRPARFVMSRIYYSRWYIRWFLDLYRVIPISPTGSGAALRRVTAALESGECVILFPEGAISRNGQLGAFRRGFSIPAVRSGCPIVPFYLNGLQGSRWSVATRHFRRNSADARLRDVNVRFGEPLPSTATPQEVKHAVTLLSVTAWQDFARTRRSIPETWLRMAARAPRRLTVTDASGLRLTNAELFYAALQLAEKLRSKPGTAVGILLPPGVPAVLSNLAVLMAGKTMVNLDPSLSPDTLAGCMSRADVKLVLTSEKEWGKMSDLSVEPLFVEVPRPSAARTAATQMALLLPFFLLRLLLPTRSKNQDTAAIVFVHREGEMQGVCLSHAGIITNARQTASLFPPRGDDVWLTALPLHQALGLITGMFLPLLESVPLVCHHDPDDAKTMGRLCVRFKGTILCAEPDMLCSYIEARSLHPLMLESLRLVLSAGGRLSERCLRDFRVRFGLIIHNGYGTPESSPIAAMNARDVLNPADMGIQCGRKSGTVGSAVPGSALRMVRPETLPHAPEDVAPGESGRILIGGEIMQGYLGREDLTARAVVEQDGIRWHVTQDTGRLDEDGFLVLEQAGPAESGCKGRPAKKIRVRLEPENREVELDRVNTVLQLLRKVDRKPGQALVIRDGRLLTPDLHLQDGDAIIVRDVGSRG